MNAPHAPDGPTAADTAAARRGSDRVVVTAGAPLRGSVRTPGDKSISHRALLLGAMADGRSTLQGLSDGDDVARTRAAVAALGAGVQETPDGTVSVEGGPGRLRTAGTPIDCGNSGTGLRLLAGLVAGLAGTTVLTGDASLSGRPMDRIAEPLRQMGATVSGAGPRTCPPLSIGGGSLRAITYTLPVASSQVKSCILLAGVQATGETVVREPVATRAHTEELLDAMGADLTVRPLADGAGREIRLRPGPLRPLNLSIPGDPSQAAFWVVAACVVPGSACTVENVYAGPARTGFVGVLRRMGAVVDERPSGSPHIADLLAASGRLSATTVDATEIPSLDEVPILAVAAARAAGTTVFRGVAELRVKEVDRFAATIELVRSFGADAEADGDDLVVHGVGPGGTLRGGHFHSRGDHRMAMAAVVAAAAAAAGSTSEIEGMDAVVTSYPAFLRDFAALGGAAA
jgi:3-phosphoshikimate 1-carboxyvinyltransferase